MLSKQYSIYIYVYLWTSRDILLKIMQNTAAAFVIMVKVWIVIFHLGIRINVKLLLAMEIDVCAEFGLKYIKSSVSREIPDYSLHCDTFNTSCPCSTSSHL